MEALHRPRRRRPGQRVPKLALIAGLFLHPPQIPQAAAVAVGIPGILGNAGSHVDTIHRLDRRFKDEHVVLADCRDKSQVVSSQIAYFDAEPGPTPQDVAVVVTKPGQAALWVNTITWALFTATGTNFTATLGPRVEEGQFAGTGDNGYGNFSCYQRYVKALYTYGNTECSQVYDCDHSDPSAATGGRSGSGALSQGAVIAIAVGVVGGVLFLVAAGLVIWFFRRSRKRRSPRNSQHSGELLRPSTLSPGPSSQADEDKSTISRPLMTQMLAIYEMDGRRFRIEVASDNGRLEMDAHGHGSAELGSGKEGAATDGAAVSPLSPGSPIEPPPPSYTR